ncbi:MAG: DUF3592 domain-containing protein [Verrucomicrobia bacterium]|nr:DUF3592 domain-containing protein [Verrucomicrobiota bacterium]
MNTDSPPFPPGENTTKPGRTHATSRARLGRRGGMPQPGWLSPSLTLTDRLIWTALFCFFLVLTLVIGGVFAGVAVVEGKTYAWKKTDCVILKSQVDEPGPYRGLRFLVSVQYEYVWQGRTYRSDRFTDGDASVSDYRKAWRWAERFPEDRQSMCFVNPSDPAQAVLSHVGVWPSQLFGLIALFPLTFAAIMAGLLHWIWRRPKPPPTQSLVLRLLSMIKHWLGAGMAVVVGSVFLLSGSAFLYFGVGKPFLQSLRARSWTQTPCVVLSSGMFKGKAFHLYVLYAYEFNDRQYKSSCGQFGQTGSSDGRGKKAFVARYPAGHKAVCYVNPEDPSQAVLDRGMNREDLWVRWFVSHFVVIGAAILFFAFRYARNKPISNRVRFFLWTLAAATISNEVVGLFALQRVIPAWRPGGRVTIGLIADTAIMVVFGLMGLVLLVLFLVALAGLFRPRQKGSGKRAVSEAVKLR